MQLKKCKVCKRQYQPRNSMQSVCSPQCALEHAKQARHKVVKSEIRQRKAQLKTKAQWLKEAQSAFNAFVRVRDHNLPCISCQRYHAGQYHAGHYRTTKAAPQLRFNLYNVHKQCAPCNSHLSGNITEYRINLIRRIGQARVDAIECSNSEGRYSIEYAKRIKKIFTKRQRLYIKLFRST